MNDAEQAILTVLRQRGSTKSICPSEAARIIAPEDWRAKMHAVREAGKVLSDQGQIDVLRKGKPVDPHSVKGVIRYRLKSDDPE